MNILPDHVNQSFFNYELDLKVTNEEWQNIVINSMRKEVNDKFEEIIRKCDKTISNIIKIDITNKDILFTGKSKKFVAFLKELDNLFDNVYLICLAPEYNTFRDYNLSIGGYSPMTHDALSIIIQLNGKLPHIN